MNMMKKSKKAFFPGWQYVVAFFILGIIFLFYVGFYDFFKVEVFTPTSEFLIEDIEKLTNSTNLTNPVIAAMYTNQEVTLGLTPDFNLLFIFIFTYFVIASLISASLTPKGSVTTLFFNTVGGIMYLFFILNLVVMQVLEYIRIDFINYIFGDLVFNLIPFYQYIIDNWGVVLLIWAGGLILANWLFGKEKVSSSRSFIGG